MKRPGDGVDESVRGTRELSSGMIVTAADASNMVENTVKRRIAGDISMAGMRRFVDYWAWFRGRRQKHCEIT